MMRRSVLVVTTLSIFILAVSVGAASAADRWLHVRVLEAGEDTRVNVNIPLSLIGQLLPLVQVDAFEGGRLQILDEVLEDTGVDIRAMWETLRGAQDGEYVTVESGDENVRIEKTEGFLMIHVDGKEDAAEKVLVRFPLEVVDALFSGDENTIDLLAAIQALGRHSDANLVSVQDGDTSVRIWVDDSMNGR